MSIFEKLQDIMATTLDISPAAIKENTTMEDIEEWDSLGHVHVMVALEQAFDLYMEVDDFAELNSVSAILKFLEAESVG
jgi:acyl carrier protein